MLKVSDFLIELKLKDNAHVADFGCGVGENTKILSEMLSNGKVFAIDVYKDLLEHLELDIKKELKKENSKYQNIIPVWGNIEELDGTRLRDESVDAIVITNTFFNLKHKKTCVMEAKRILKKRGKILFIDWHKPLGQAIMHKQVILNEKEIEKLFTELDFKVSSLIHKDDNHYVLIIEK